MEKFDVLNSDGTTTGQIKARADVHRDGDWHRTVHIWLLNDKGELLLQLRGPHQEANPNCWDISSAGHLDAGETMLDGAQRELAEELGVKLPLDRFQHLFTCQGEFRAPGLIDKEISEIYLLKWCPSDPPFKLCEQEVQEVKWLHWRSLREKVHQSSPDYVDHPEEYQKLFCYLEQL